MHVMITIKKVLIVLIDCYNDNDDTCYENDNNTLEHTITSFPFTVERNKILDSCHAALKKVLYNDTK